MVRMSDILKKAKGIKKEEEKPDEKAPQAQEAPPLQAPAPPKKEKPPQPQVPVSEKIEIKKVGEKEAAPKTSGVRISSLVMKDAKTSLSDEGKRSYEETLSLAQELIKKNVDFKTIDIKKFIIQVEKIINQLSQNGENMSALAFSAKSEDYLAFHLVNVCIYSIKIGLGLGYDKFKLIDLGVSALLHDVGMTKYMDLASQRRKLDAKEYDKIKRHPESSVEMVENIIGVTRPVIQAVHQAHERIDGSGYPEGLKDGKITEYAKIIGLADVYSALTHPRPYRDQYACLEVIKIILGNKAAFEKKIVKVLIDKFGIFPVGCFVELNTKETASVIAVNHKYPMQPTVKVIYDSEGNRLEKEKVINLSTRTNNYITKCTTGEMDLNP